jgi:hypothetical protein
VSYEVIYEVQFIDLAAGFIHDDAQGVAALFADVDQLAGRPRPETSFPYGSPFGGGYALAGIGSCT